MLEQEINRLRGIEEKRETEITTDRGSGFIPESYIPQEDVRITTYRRLLNSVGIDEFEALMSEMADRFGKIPSEAEYLAGLTAVRKFGRDYGVESVEVRKGMVKINHKGVEVPDKFKKYLKMLGRNIKFL